VDLFELLPSLQARGLRLPLLVRFSTSCRVACAASQVVPKAIGDYSYAAFPRRLPDQGEPAAPRREEIVRYGAPHRIGLEAARSQNW